MWQSGKLCRKTNLIVPKVTYSNMTGSLNNEHWEYKVPYAFIEALDIKYEQRMKDKKPYMVWTQGPILSFKLGDLLTTRDEKKSAQVRFANQMSWNESKNEMYEGNVFFDVFEINNGKYIKTRNNTCNQMQFLEMLIYPERELILQ